MNKQGNLQVFDHAIPNYKSFLTNFAKHTKDVTEA